MAAELVTRYPYLKESYFDAADRILGTSLSALCLSGSAEELRDTEVTQPAVYLMSVAILDVLRSYGLEPSVVAGHSLGEYSALVAAGVLDWAEGLRLVRCRATAMARSTRPGDGAMAALMGLTAGAVETICAAITGSGSGLVEPANYNAPDQVVVSGTAHGVRAAVGEALRLGAAKAVFLDVGAPFHCSLMAEAQAGFADDLARVRLRSPSVSVISSVTAAEVNDVEQIRGNLVRQLTGPVRWNETMELIGRRQAGLLVEVGPGRVLTGLAGKILPGTPAFGTGTGRHLDALMRHLAVPASHLYPSA